MSLSVLHRIQLSSKKILELCKIHAAADKICQSGMSESNCVAPAVYVDDKTTDVSKMYKTVEMNAQKTSLARRESYNKKKISFQRYKVGDLVWLKNTGGKRNASKSLPPWYVGTYVIVRSVSDAIYILKRPHRYSDIIRDTVVSAKQNIFTG